MFCRAWSGSKLFAKVISRWQKSPLAGRELKKKTQFKQEWKESYRTNFRKIEIIMGRAYADSEGPDQPAHSRSLLWAFTVC